MQNRRTKSNDEINRKTQEIRHSFVVTRAFTCHTQIKKDTIKDNDDSYT